MEMTRDTNVSAAEWNDTLASVRECSPADPLWHPPRISPSPAEAEEEKKDWKLPFPEGEDVPPVVPVELNHPRSPTWDETVNWSKSAHRSTASASSVEEGDSLASTQLFPAPDTLHRVVSYDSSTFSSAGLEEGMGLLTPPPAFFTPRRRLNSTAPDVPEAVTVSFGGANNWSDTEDEDRLPLTNNNTIELDSKTSIHCGWKERLLRFFVISGGGASHRSSANRRAPPTRRNLLFLFLVAVYTTFGLASPHLRVVIPQDALTLGPLPATTIAPVLALEMTDQESSSQRKTFRGSLNASSNTSNKGHLSFARGAKKPRQLLYRPRRDELNDFLHQSAVQEEEAASGAWYFNCLVLIGIALWWSLKKERPSSSSIRRG